MKITKNKEGVEVWEVEESDLIEHIDLFGNPIKDLIDLKPDVLDSIFLVNGSIKVYLKTKKGLKFSHINRIPENLFKKLTRFNGVFSANKDSVDSDPRLIASKEDREYIEYDLSHWENKVQGILNTAHRWIGNEVFVGDSRYPNGFENEEYVVLFRIRSEDRDQILSTAKPILSEAIKETSLEMIKHYSRRLRKLENHIIEEEYLKPLKLIYGTVNLPRGGFEYNYVPFPEVTFPNIDGHKSKLSRGRISMLHDYYWRYKEDISIEDALMFSVDYLNPLDANTKGNTYVTSMALFEFYKWLNSETHDTTEEPTEVDLSILIENLGDYIRCNVSYLEDILTKGFSERKCQWFDSKNLLIYFLNKLTPISKFNTQAEFESKYSKTFIDENGNEIVMQKGDYNNAFRSPKSNKEKKKEIDSAYLLAIQKKSYEKSYESITN